MAIDDSFKKQGAVPFKWEIRPGVPKVKQQEETPTPPPSNHHCSNNNGSYPRTKSEKLRPPPASPTTFHFPTSLEPRTRSVKSAPRTRSEHIRFDRSILRQPEIVSLGCFTSPLLTRKREKRSANKLPVESDSEQECMSDIETLSRRSSSTRKSLSPFRASPLSSSFSSYQSSPRPVSDAEWAGFGLF